MTETRSEVALAEPWLVDAEAVGSELGTDPGTGLTSAEAAERLERFGPNALEPEAEVPAWRKLLAQFADPLVYLLLAAVAISLVTWVIEGAHGVPFEAVVIAAILIANAVLGYVQEARAEEAVAALQRMAAPMSTVLRDGDQRRVPTGDVVPGDVLVLAEGDAVGADGRLTEAASLTVAEASLTGESEPILKDVATLTGSVALGDRTNMVFSGTAVTRGRGRAVVSATGMSTEMGRIARLLGETEEERTPLQREIDHVGRTLGIIVLVIAAIVVAAILLTSPVDEPADVVDVLIVGVSLAVAAVPEGLPAVLSVVLALGVQRMARKNAIVKQLSSVETLGSATVICSDKTGTLTRNEMTILRVVTRSGEVEVTGVGHAPDGEFVVDGNGLQPGPLLEEVRAAVSLGALANDASVREEAGEWVVHGDPTEAAFLIAERKAGFIEGLDQRFRRVGEVPFTSERKLMSTLQVDLEHDDGRVILATKGAPDVLLARCTHEQVGEEPVPLDEERRRRIVEVVDVLAGQAFRTLGTAYRSMPDGLPDEPEEIGEDLERDLVFVGVVGIIDPPRVEAKVAIDEARRAGIRVLMITGDHPRTAARIAEELDMAEADARTVTGVEIGELGDEAFREAVREAPVYARVAPEHKLRIVDALQADGHVVAMTGDGVNDAPALKRADIGVAMGITGTDVAKEAANMILADDNFATIVAAVREGRGIFSNIRKFLRYLLSSNAGEVLTMFFGVLGAGLIGLDAAGGAAAVPLLATQILWINLLTDAAPALAMGVDPPPDDVMERSPRRLTARVIDAGMQTGVAFVGSVMAAATLLTLDIGLPGGMVEGTGTLTEARTMAFTTLVLAQLFNCFNARSERVSAFHNLFTNPWLWGAIALSLVLQIAVIYLPFLNRPFGTTGLDPGEWLLCTVMASTVLWANEIRKLVGRWRRGVTARSAP
ncbi:MAG TPA: cation-translocating P-type ATPase [Actinomycetota bacterium]|nr:cation-translocating P-type ATPase [Actinomycetota bacterium]